MNLKDNCHRLILSAKKSLIERVLGDEIKRFRKKKITDDMTEREKWAAIIKNNAHLLNNESGFVDMAKGLWNIGEEHIPGPTAKSSRASSKTVNRPS